MDIQTLAVALAKCGGGSNSIADFTGAGYSAESVYAEGAFVVYGNKIYECVEAITTPEAWNPEHWQERTLEYWISSLNDGTHLRFGVKGVGGENAELTRLWDSDGFYAEPGTDTRAGMSNFDAFRPFNRRKCVGSWSAGDGKAVFTVNAYYGDADYTEDGSMGDYVAVDIEPFYYFESGDVIGVSEHPFPEWKIHPVCIDKDGNVRPHTYIPCYAMAQMDGHAVSLPGYHNVFGDYAKLRGFAETYANEDVAGYAEIEPSTVDHYEWLLFTIEYATQNCQNVMYGASSMRVNNSDKITLAPADNQVVVTKTIGNNFVIGQSVYFGSNADASPSNVTFYNAITNMRACDADGTLNDSGEYWLIDYDGPNREIEAGTTAMGSRPWISGACGGYAPNVGAVMGHTGSPVSNSNGKYPMMYRWRENVWSNQYMTAGDLFNVRVEEETNVYRLDWYLLTDQSKFKKNASVNDFTEANGFIKLSVTTPSAKYANGYIKTLDYDPIYPYAKVPVDMTGSNTKYYCDYAYLVNSAVVRSVRRRGYLTYGAFDGLRYFYANYAPSYGHWSYGAGLYMAQ